MGKHSDDKLPLVISKHGSYRFRRGLVTAAALQQGLGMDVALAASKAVRDQLIGTEEITAEALQTTLRTLLRERYGWSPTPPAPTAAEKLVRADDGVFPFSRGVLLRRMVAAGLNMEAALPLVEKAAAEIALRPEPEIARATVTAIAARLVTEAHGESFGRRYRLTGTLHTLDRPVIILVGGAVGTGKSSLATELAYRLGIRKVTSTDMIRETMRTVLSPEVVPGLHDHSFRGMIQGHQVLSDPRERVLAGFHQQAAQVAVGVRAVIRRAIRERTHMIIEGTHLLPPFTHLVPPGASMYLAGLVLSVPGRKLHRSRFPMRAQDQPQREADTYLDAFQSVRWIHDDIMRLAEEYDAYLIENIDLRQTLTGAVDHLSRAIPLDAKGRPGRLPADSTAEPRPWVRTLMIVLDGLADEPNAALDNQTPLAAAETPVLGRLAGAGAQGLLATTPPGDEAHTDVGLMTLLWEGGPRPRIGRGLMEALGNGLPVNANSVVLRGNMATFDPDGVIIDRRAGRIRTGVADLVSGLKDIALPGGVIGHVFAGHEHRVVVMLNGSGLSAAVCDSDPGNATKMQRAEAIRPLDDTPEAARTAEALDALLRIAREHLEQHPYNAARIARGQHPANGLLTRGAASASGHSFTTHAVRPSAIVAACPTVLGVGRAAGLTPVSSSRMTGNASTDVVHKFDRAIRELRTHELVVVHFKATDVTAHDRRPLEKRDFISRVDAALGNALNAYEGPLRVVVTCDHGTSSTTGVHLPDPVPLLISTWDANADPIDFDERSAAQGELGLVAASEFTALLWGPATAS